MILYIFSIPVWNFVLPLYAFWNFDNFSWGQTRRVEKSKDQRLSVLSIGNGYEDRERLLKTMKWSNWMAERENTGMRLSIPNSGQPIQQPLKNSSFTNESNSDTNSIENDEHFEIADNAIVEEKKKTNEIDDEELFTELVSDRMTEISNSTEKTYRFTDTPAQISRSEGSVNQNDRGTGGLFGEWRQNGLREVQSIETYKDPAWLKEQKN
ncbi:hypothetical protein HK096_005067 [Nowakowskiella sp. JEL0078]|nr:hypothetical protein HK096_005067 [Nowakowskiella sp. JEL0078]